MPTMDPTAPLAEAFDDFQLTQTLPEDEDTQPPLGHSVWAVLQPLNRSMPRIDLNRSIVLLGRPKEDLDNDDSRSPQRVKLAGLVIS